MKKRYWIPLLILLILIAARIALPFWVEDYVNRTLRDLPGYSGSITDVDINLYRGAYRIDSLVIDKVDSTNSVPFLGVRTIDLSVEWSALLNGALVGEVVLIEPVLNFVADDQDPEYGQDVDWTEPIKELLPIRINRFAIERGSIHYVDPHSSPQIDLPLHNLDLEILNITNAEHSEEDLPSPITLSGTSVGGGTVSIDARANLIRQIPDLDLNFEFESVHLPALNEFMEAYANVNAEEGEFNLYSEIVIDEGQLEGYVRPVIRGLKVINLKEGNVLENIWEGIVGLTAELFENQSEDQIATEVPLEGDLNNPDTGTWPAVWNVFRNAFVEAFSRQTTGEIDFFGEEENGN